MLWVQNTFVLGGPQPQTEYWVATWDEVIRSWLNPVSVSALTTSGILLRYATKNINGAPAALQISLPKLGRVGQLLDTARLPPRSMHLDMPLDYLVNDLQMQGA